MTTHGLRAARRARPWPWSLLPSPLPLRLPLFWPPAVLGLVPLLWLVSAVWLVPLLLWAPPAPAAGDPPLEAAARPAPDAAAPGVVDAQRAWQHWTLNCQGCHRPDGTGSDATAPSLAQTVGKFLRVPGGREYLGRVPGVAASPLSDADLAEVLNWMLWRFDAGHVPAGFLPYTAVEVGRLRSQPLRMEASQVRRDLLQKAQRSSVR